MQRNVIKNHSENKNLTPASLPQMAAGGRPRKKTVLASQMVDDIKQIISLCHLPEKQGEQVNRELTAVLERNPHVFAVLKVQFTNEGKNLQDTAQKNKHASLVKAFTTANLKKSKELKLGNEEMAAIKQHMKSSCDHFKSPKSPNSTTTDVKGQVNYHLITSKPRGLASSLEVAVVQHDSSRFKEFCSYFTKEKIQQAFSVEQCMALHHAIHFDKTDAALLLISYLESGQLNIKDTDGYTPLFFATQKRNVEIVKAILAKLDKNKINEKISPISKNGEKTLGAAALYFALCQKDIDISKEIIQALPSEQLNEELDEKTRGTALQVAAFHGYEKIVRYLVERLTPNQIIKKGYNDFTSLDIAAQRGYLNIIKILIDKLRQSDTGGIAQWGNASLYLAAKYQHKEVVHFLVEHFPEQLMAKIGVDEALILNGVAENGNVPLFIWLADKLEVSQLNAQNKMGMTALHYAVYHHRLEMVQYLLKRFESDRQYLYTKAKKGTTALHVAIEIGSLPIVIELIKNIPCPLSELYKNNDTFLHVAAGKSSNISVFRFLVENVYKQEELHLANDKGVRPLDMAIVKNKLDIASLLIEKLTIAQLIDNHFRDWRGWTPLHLAVCYGNLKAAQLLIEKFKHHQVDFSALAYEGITPLHLAVLEGKDEMVELLLHSYPMNVNYLVGGYSILHDAILSENEAIIRLLLNHPIDVNVRDLDGKTALQLAQERGVAEDIINSLQAASRTQWNMDKLLVYQHCLLGTPNYSLFFKKSLLIEQHCILETPHPSPFSVEQNTLIPLLLPSPRDKKKEYKTDPAIKVSACVADILKGLDEKKPVIDSCTVAPQEEGRVRWCRERFKYKRFKEQLSLAIAQQEKNSRYSAFLAYEEKVCQPSKQAFEALNYYKVTVSERSDFSRPVYVHVPADIKTKAESYGVWESIHKQLTNNLQFIEKDDKERIGLRQLKVGIYELANKGRKGGASDKRLCATQGLVEASILNTDILVLELNVFAKSHNALKKKIY